MKAKEIGSEATPAEFLDTLLALTAEWGRLLAPHGSICVELGDTYAGSGGAGGDYGPDGLRDGQERFNGAAAVARAHAVKERTRSPGTGWPLDKSLCGIPTLYAWSLAYGRNLLTGQPSPAGQWRVRNLVAWVRPNPPVGALGDKFRPATSYLTIACRARDRYFDLDAVRVPYSGEMARLIKRGRNRNPPDQSAGIGSDWTNHDGFQAQDNGGAPPLDWWNIPPSGYPGAHYAVYPPELCVRPILAMTPTRVCTTCGEPSRRIVGDVEYVNTRDGQPARLKPDGWRSGGGKLGGSMVNQSGGSGHDQNATRVAPTVGWSDCGHGTWRPGHVLDPFAGSGTTLAVATGHGRQATGIDIDPRNAQLAQQRCGMFLTIEENPAVAS